MQSQGYADKPAKLSFGDRIMFSAVIITISALWIVSDAPFWVFFLLCSIVGIFLGAYKLMKINPVVSLELKTDEFEVKKVLQLTGQQVLRNAYLASLSGSEFEDEIKQLFELEGYVARKTTPGTPGIDIIAHKVDMDTGEILQKVVCQCKRYSDNVSLDKVVDFYTHALQEGYNDAYFFTTSAFSIPAISFARRKGITLVDKEALKDAKGI